MKRKGKISTKITCEQRMHNNLEAFNIIRKVIHKNKQSTEYIEIFTNGRAILLYPDFTEKEISIDTNFGLKILKSWADEQYAYWNASNSNKNGHRRRLKRKGNATTQVDVRNSTTGV